MNVQEAIERYSERLEDTNYIHTLLQSVEPDSLLETLTVMLQSSKPEPILAANLFIRDVLLLPSQDSARSFRAAFYTSALVDALNKNVFANRYGVRRNTVYTIGKVLLKSSIPVLVEGFQRSLEHDPLLLPELLAELSWLGDRNEWSRIEEMADSPHDLTRWAVLSTYLFDSFPAPQNEQEARFVQAQMHYLDLLREDSHRLIRREAEHKAIQCQAAQAVGSVEQAERAHITRVPEFEAPLITFDQVEVLFGSYMVKTHKDDYIPTELEGFVLSM